MTQTTFREGDMYHLILTYGDGGKMHSNGDMVSLAALAHSIVDQYSARQGTAWSEEGVTVTLTKWKFDENQTGTEVEAPSLSIGEIEAVTESIYDDPTLAWFLGLAGLYPTGLPATN